MACLSLFHGIWRPSLEDPSGWVGAGTVRRLLHTPGARPGVTWTPAPARPVAGEQEHVGSSHSLGSLPAWQPRRSVVGVPPWSPPAATRSCTGFHRSASEGRTLRPRPGAVRSRPVCTEGDRDVSAGGGGVKEVMASSSDSQSVVYPFIQEAGGDLHGEARASWASWGGCSGACPPPPPVVIPCS